MGIPFSMRQRLHLRILSHPLLMAFGSVIIYQRSALSPFQEHIPLSGRGGLLHFLLVFNDQLQCLWRTFSSKCPPFSLFCWFKKHHQTGHQKLIFIWKQIFYIQWSTPPLFPLKWYLPFILSTGLICRTRQGNSLRLDHPYEAILCSYQIFNICFAERGLHWLPFTGQLCLLCLSSFRNPNFFPLRWLALCREITVYMLLTEILL